MRKICKGILCVFVVVMSMIFMSGCGNKIKNEDALKADLMESSYFSMVEGSKISKFTIIKRLTEKEKREDTVWVSLEIDHESATETRSYIMYYKEYNDGWLLDSFLSFNDVDHQWKVTPKKTPSNEEVMDALLKRSRDTLDALYLPGDLDALLKYSQGDINALYNYSQAVLTTWLERYYSYWFEEGKYVTRVIPREMLSETSYQCFTVTDQAMPFGEIYEKTTTLRSLTFTFNVNTYEWELIEVAKLAFDSTTSDAPVVFEETGVIDLYEDEIVKQYNDKVVEFLTYFYEERDIKRIKEMLHPSFDELYPYIESDFHSYQRSDLDITLLCTIPGTVEFYELDDEEAQELKEIGVNVEEFVIYYCDVVISDENDVEFENLEAYFIKVDGNIYLFNIE